MSKTPLSHHVTREFFYLVKLPIKALHKDRLAVQRRKALLFPCFSGSLFDGF